MWNEKERRLPLLFFLCTAGIYDFLSKKVICCRYKSHNAFRVIVLSISELNLMLEQRQKEVNYDINRLSQVIFYIINLHRRFCEENRDIQQINLRKLLVKDVCKQIDIDKFIIYPDYYNIIKKYLYRLGLLTPDMISFEADYIDLDSRSRVKELGSVIYKLGHYYLVKEEKGEMPLKKCLNDLMGFRVCLPGFSHDCPVFQEMCNFIKNDYNIKCINSSKGEYYRGTHVYFYGDSNKNFPWELQIWLTDDVQTNLNSHEKHKQKYVKFAEFHKDAFN